MKHILAFAPCFILLISPLHSAEPFFKKLACANQVFSTISGVGTPTKWVKNKKLVSSKLEEGGSVSVLVKEKQSIVSVEKELFKARAVIKAPDCKIKIKSFDNDLKGFRDENLKKLVSKNKSGMIYLWSPHMTISVQELSEIFLARKKIKTPFTILLDKNADMDLAKKMVSDLKLPIDYLLTMNSRKLEKFGVTIHFPSLVIYKNGKLKKRVPGYTGVPGIQDMIKEHL